MPAERNRTWPDQKPNEEGKLLCRRTWSHFCLFVCVISNEIRPFETMVEKEDFLCFLLLLHRLHSTCLKAKLSNPFIRQFDYTRRRKCFPILLSRKWNDRVVIPVCLLLCSVGPNWTSGCIAALIYPSDRLKLVKKKREKILSQRRRGNGVECSNWAETIPSHFFLIFFPPHFLGDQRLKFSYSSLCLLFCLTYFYVISSVNVHTEN